MIRNLYSFSLFLLIVFIINMANVQAGTDNNGYIINITDIHFDPFYDSSIVQELIDSDVEKWDSIFKKSNNDSFGNYSTDTNYNLFASALESIKENAPNPDFLIYSGDFICHSFNSQFASFDKSNTASNEKLHDFIYKTVKFVIMKLSETFPNTPFFLALGNDDSYVGDYQIEFDGAFLKDTSELFKQKIFFASLEQATDFYRTYESGGFYCAGVPNIDNAEIIVLNSIFYTSNYMYKGEPDANPGRLELSWFADKLEKAVSENKRLWIITHVPLGINVYSTLSESQNSNGQITSDPAMYIENDFNIKFVELIRKFHKNIEVIFVGHTHMDWFELYNDKDGEYIAFNHLSPAISPVYGNNPAYQIITYDRRNFNLKDYTVFYLNLTDANKSPNNAAWEKEYTFTEAYNQESYSLSSLKNVYKTMISSNSGATNNYIDFYIVGNASQSYIDSTNWFNYYLGIGCLLKDDFMNNASNK